MLRICLFLHPLIKFCQMHVNCDFTVLIIVVYMYTFFYGLLSLLKMFY